MITLGGFPIYAQWGRPRSLALIEETRQKTGLFVDNSGESAIDALTHLGVKRIAIASRWADQLNRGVLAYLTHAGFEVLTITTEGQMRKEAAAMSIERGIVLAIQLGREAMRQAPQAEAILLVGGAWRSLAAVPILEADFGVPAVPNYIAQEWRLLHDGIAPPVKGWGKLLEAP